MHLLDSQLGSYSPAFFRAVYSAVQAKKQFGDHFPSNFGFRDLLVAWSPVAKMHAREIVNVATAQSLDQSSHVHVMKWLDMSNWAMAAYDAQTRTGVAAALGLKLDDVLHVHNNEDSAHAGSNLKAASKHDYLPAYYIAIDHDERAVRVVVRGTSVIKDMLADIQGTTSAFCAGHAHSGMALAARALVEEELPRLEGVIKTQPGYQILFLGHSLGGGIAALAACLLRWDAQLSRRVQGTPVTAVTFASPPVLTRDLADQSCDFIRSIINNNDVVPRASMSSVVELVHELAGAKERLCEEHKITASVAGGAVQVGKEGQLIGKAIGEVAGQTFEAASLSLLSSLRRSAVQWTEKSDKEQQQQHSAASHSTIGTQSSSYKPSFFSSLASAAVSLIDSTVPATNLADMDNAHSKQQGANAQGGTLPGQRPEPTASALHAPAAAATATSAANIEPTAPAAANPAVSTSEPGGLLGQSILSQGIQQQHGRQPQDGRGICALETSQTQGVGPAAPVESVSPTATFGEEPAATHASGVASGGSSVAVRASSGSGVAPVEGVVDVQGEQVPVDLETLELHRTCADLEASEEASAIAASADSVDPSPSAPPLPARPAAAPSSNEAAMHRLYIPGVLYYIHRDGKMCHLFKNVKKSEFDRLLIKQSGLTDHTISAYRGALTDIIYQLSTLPGV